MGFGAVRLWSLWRTARTESRPLSPPTSSQLTSGPVQPPRGAPPSTPSDASGRPLSLLECPTRATTFPLERGARGGLSQAHRPPAGSPRQDQPLGASAPQPPPRLAGPHRRLRQEFRKPKQTRHGDRKEARDAGSELASQAGAAGTSRPVQRPRPRLPQCFVSLRPEATPESVLTQGQRQPPPSLEASAPRLPANRYMLHFKCETNGFKSFSPCLQ